MIRDEQLDEFTRSDVMKNVEGKVKRRSKVLNRPTYLGVTKDYVVHMNVDSSTGVGSYVVRVKLDEYPSIEDLPDISTQEKVRLALAGDVKINCTCPAFRYWGYEYITTQIDLNDYTKQDIYPHIRNPKLEGICCKHIFKALNMYGSYWKSIAKDIEERNFIKE